MFTSKINWKLNDKSLRKELLKLSKPQLIKLCKIRKVSINGNKQEIVNALLKKNGKKKKTKSLKSKKTTQPSPPKSVEVKDQKSNDTSNTSPNETKYKQDCNEKETEIAPLQRINNIKQPAIKENPNIYILICLYWLRIHLNLTQSSSLIFPMNILKFIHQLSSTYTTRFMHSYSGGALRTFHLIFNTNNNLFQMEINLIKTNDNSDAILNGSIHYDQLLYFNENCSFEVINGFNYLLNHDKRKKEYIKRTIHLYLLHNIKKSIDEIQILYEDNRIITKDIDYFDELEDEIDDYEDPDGSDEDIQDRICNEPDFFDYHNIYCEICYKLNEKPNAIYIGGQFRIERESRYYAILYFNEYKLCELNNNIFEIWSFIKYKQYEDYKPMHQEYRTIKLLIDKELKYFEFCSKFGTEYKRCVEFKGKGKFINDELLFDNEFKHEFKKFIQLDEKQDIVVVFKETKGIFINNTLKWNMKRTSHFHGSYYSHDQ